MVSFQNPSPVEVAELNSPFSKTLFCGGHGAKFPHQILCYSSSSMAMDASNDDAPVFLDRTSRVTRGKR